MNIKGKNQNNFKVKSVNKYWDWDDLQHNYSKNGRLITRMERHIAKQDLKKQVKYSN